jgi:2-polyprenyl-3-methyl-5-hydroxy-6-metoxy-1,4-benzoquinol methylase
MMPPPLPSSATKPTEIRSRPNPTCYLCGAAGEWLYVGLKDRLFGAPGDWNIKRCPDRRCGLLWLDPIPLEQDIGKAYKAYYTHHDAVPAISSSSRRRRLFDYVKAAYLAEQFGLPGPKPGIVRQLAMLLAYVEAAFRTTVEFPLRALAHERKGRLLDVGCGDGSTLDIARRLGWQVVGVDFDPTAAATARRKGLTVRLGKLEDQGFDAGSFDMVVMNHVIEHVHDPLGTIRECRRVLDPGGVLLLATPNAKSWGHTLFDRNCRILEPPRHLHLFTAANLRKLASDAGFRSVLITSTARLAPFVFYASDQLLAEERSESTRSTQSWATRLRGRKSIYAETLRTLWRPMTGEELLVEARE